MKNIIYSICCLAIMSCNTKPVEEKTPIEVQNETPEVLEKEGSYDIKSITKREYSDIISKLYEEALEKNKELNAWNDALNNIPQVENDSTQSFNKYNNVNKNYWAVTENYITRMKDSTLRETTKTLFKTLEGNYKKKIALHESKLNTISKKAISLNDQFILMQLMITQPMMQNYQTNELPNIESLNGIIEEYNKLIKESEALKK